MDQAAREDKRQVKKRQHKKNRKACKDGLRKEDFDNQDVLDWKELNSDDR